MIKIAIAATALLFATAAVAGETRTYSVGDSSYHIYFGSDLDTVQGRAAALAVVEKAAAKLCRDQSVKMDSDVCAAKVVDAAIHSAKGRLLGVALAERNGVQLAAK